MPHKVCKRKKQRHESSNGGELIKVKNEDSDEYEEEYEEEEEEDESYGSELQVKKNTSFQKVNLNASQNL